MTLLEATGFTAYRGERPVAHAERLAVEEGETLGVLGPNGAGKTSLLLALARLLPARGELRFRGQPVGDALAYRRRVGVVLQRALLLDRSVRDNVALGLELRGVERRERERRADAELARLGIAHLAARPARSLSGGEAQRASLARALATDPEVLFLDEPFAALDAPTRETLIADLGGLLRERGATAVVVTHDRDEALSLSDRIAVVMAGRVRQVGPAEEVLTAPADPEIAAFVGIENVVPARVERVTEELTLLRVAGHLLEVTAMPPAGDDLPFLCVSPDEIVISHGDAAGTSARNALAGRIVRVEPIGRRVRLLLDCGFPLVAHVTHRSAREMRLAPGDGVVASFKATVPHLLPRHRRSVGG